MGLGKQVKAGCRRKGFVRSRIHLTRLLLAAGTGILLFPLFADAVTEVLQSRRISRALEEDVRDPLAVKADAERAEAYNRDIAAGQKQRPFIYHGTGEKDGLYQSLLDGPDGQMGVLTVPAAGICLPVMHGTDEQTLLTAAGHMHGTSLPVGGRSTHCVIAGHSGLATARLFTDLRMVTVGDEVSVSVLGEVHRYSVSEIRTVLPEEEARYLQVEEGQDLLTLYTCTPVGVNDRRLLVCCRRSLPDPEPGPSDQAASVRSRGLSALSRAFLLAAAPAVILFIPRRSGKVNRSGSRMSAFTANIDLIGGIDS